MYGHDPEAIYQEADFLQAQYEEEAALVSALHKKGVCTHGWLLGQGTANASAEEIALERSRGDFPARATDPAVTDQASIPAGECLCLDCGTLVPDPLAGLIA